MKRTSPLPSILLTGFEPFDGSPLNASQECIRALEQAEPAAYSLHTAILPVDGRRAPRLLKKLIDDVRPSAAICLGQAAGRAVISIERVAINLLDYRVADNAGRKVVDQPVVKGGPAAYFATFPVRSMLAALHRGSVPAQASQDCGTYLCNQVAYVLLHHLAKRHRNIPAGFIHLPILPEQSVHAKDRRPSMALETLCRGIEALLLVVARAARPR